MKYSLYVTAIALASAYCISVPVEAAGLCVGSGPQTPRDITSKAGKNTRLFTLAPSPKKMNLCNIHFHVNAEHKGPGFKVSAGKGKFGGFKCNASNRLTKAELTKPAADICKGHKAGDKVLKPGDTIEVHWVHTSCKTTPGKGLGPCAPTDCKNRKLRVETQVFLVVNSKKALNFARFAYAKNIVSGLHQAKALPTGTGAPVVFHGSTTGPKYTQEKCSPLEVTWSVRPNCAKIDINSMAAWCKKNPLKEDHAHGVRPLVTAPELLAKIK